jgi:uncharacterized membrane protein YebE (DUF533 family)
MAESQTLTVIRLWAAIAWADGWLSESEGVALRKLIDHAGLDPAEKELAEGLLAKQTPLPDDMPSPNSMTDEARAGIYRAACRMAVVDQEFADEERAVLEHLKVRLQIPNEVSKKIEAEIPGLR